MKVISIQQPWATLIVIGAKKIETRSWNTKYRGEILIHASAGKKPLCRSQMMDFQQQFFHLQLPKYEDLPFGAIIGKVNIIETWRSDQVLHNIDIFKKEGKASNQEIDFGDYSPNRYGWLLSDPIQFTTPIPAKGQRGFWNYNIESFIQLIK